MRRPCRPVLCRVLHQMWAFQCYTPTMGAVDGWMCVLDGLPQITGQAGNCTPTRATTWDIPLPETPHGQGMLPSDAVNPQRLRTSRTCGPSPSRVHHLPSTNDATNEITVCARLTAQLDLICAAMGSNHGTYLPLTTINSSRAVTSAVCPPFEVEPSSTSLVDHRVAARGGRLVY